MILKLVLMAIFLVLLLFLVRKRLINIDMSFPWFISIIVLAFLSVSRDFIQGLASLLGIQYAPIVIILVALFILLGLITVLGVYITKLKRQQALIVRKLANYDLNIDE